MRKTATLRMIAVLTIMLLSGTISQAGQVGDPPKTEPPAEELIMGTATISPNIWGTICTSAEVTFWVYVSGCPGPYTINLLINNNPVSVTVQNSPYVLTLIVNSSLYVVLQSVTAPGCNITVTQPNFFQVLVRPGPTANITGNYEICQGGPSVGIPITFNTSLGMPFTFRYRANGVLQPPVTTNSNPHILNVNPAVTTVYTLTEVSNPNCTGTVTANSATVTVVNPPTASLSGDQTFCNLADSVLLVDFTGSGPYQLIYAIDSIDQPPITISSDPYQLVVNSDSSQTIYLVSVQNALCPGQASGTAQITVLSAPFDTNLVITCNPVDNNYTVSFDIENAAPPITFSQGSGVLNGVHFVSDPIHQTMPYAFTFYDSIHCQDITVSGPSSCFCVTAADSMLMVDTLSACIGEWITAVHQGNPQLDGDDSLRFILHTLPGLPIGQVLAWSDTPQFGFLPGMHPDTVYYISAIAGDFVGPDSIDLADICLSVSPGVPVLFRAIPAVFPVGDLSVCTGETAIIPLKLSGTAPFSVQFAIDGQIQPELIGLNGPIHDLPLFLNDTSLITLLQVSDQYCSSPLTDSIEVTVHFTPQISLLNVSCDWFTSSYTVSFEIQGGSAPWVVAGNAGTLNGTGFLSDPIPSGQPYQFILSDQFLCGETQVSDTVTCPCATYPGALDTTSLRLCPGETAQVLYDGAQVLDSSDTLLFYLQTASGATLSVAPVPGFQFDPGTMQFGVTYFMFAVAGNQLPGGGIDFSDPCLAISAGTPVTWFAAPTAVMNGQFDICLGETQLIPIQFSGEAPFTFEYTENGILNSLQSVNPVFDLSVAPTLSSNFLAVSVQDVNCPGTASGGASINLHTIPEITNLLQVCDPDNLHYSVSFEVVNADLATVSINATLTGQYDPATGVFESQPGDLPISYQFIVSDAWQCGQDTLISIPDCPCTTDAGELSSSMLHLCPGETAQVLHDGAQVLDGNDTLVFVLHTTALYGAGITLASAPNPGFDFDPATMQLETVYYVFALAANTSAAAGINLNDPCLSVSVGAPVVWHAAPGAVMSGDFDICPGESQLLQIDFTGTAPFQVVYTENGAPVSISTNQSSYLIPTNLSQTSVFVPVSVQDAYCSGAVSGGATVEVHTTPSIQNPVISCHPDNAHYSVVFEVTAPDLSLVQVNSTGVNGQYNPVSGHYASDEANFPDVFTIYVSDTWLCGLDSLVVSPDCPCSTDAGQLATAPLNVCVGDDIQFPGVSGQTLDLFDQLEYVLCSDPANWSQNILLRADVPFFSYSPALVPGITYYILTVAGNPLTAGGIDLNDRCLSVSQPLEVAIRARPSALIDGDTSLCMGANYTFPVMLTGAAPFTFQYSQNGVAQNPVNTSQATYPIAVNDLQQQQTFQLLSVQDQYCSGATSGQVQLSTIPLPVVTLSGADSICPGGIAQLHIDLQNTTSVDFDLMSTPGNTQHVTGFIGGHSIPVSPGVSTSYTLTNVVPQVNVCPVIAGGSAKVDLQPLSLQVSASDFHGFGISCFGAADGEAIADIAGGFDPVSIRWSTQDTLPVITDLPPGNYSVTITDFEGCTVTNQVLLTSPNPLMASWEVEDINCLEGSSGVIQFSQISQGVGPYQVQLNQNAPVLTGSGPLEISGLEGGLLELLITDANGCIFSAEDTVGTPAPLLLGLGDDQEMTVGDSAWLSPLVTGNAPFNFVWSPVETLLTPGQLSTWAVPQLTTTYSLMVTDHAGCTATDDILIRIKKTRRVYIPNVFMPESSGLNTVFTVFGGPEVKQVNYLSVFDRWGEQLFGNKNFLPDTPTDGWNGDYRGKPMPPGVYVYVVEVAFIDGETELYKGSVTIVR
jgi:gliding motility-associated-like protein